MHTGGGQARDSPTRTEQPISRPLPDDRLVGASSETSLESLIRVSRDGGLSDTSPRQSEVGVCLPGHVESPTASQIQVQYMCRQYAHRMQHVCWSTLSSYTHIRALPAEVWALPRWNHSRPAMVLMACN